MILLSGEQAASDVRPDGIWDYVSPSRLNLWLKCPLAFRLRYVDRIRLPPTPALFLGKRVHDALELFYRHRQLDAALPVEAVVQRIAATWEEAVEADCMQFASVAAEQALKQQAAGLGREE